MGTSPEASSAPVGATTERVGVRPRTVYAITPAGRAALAEWLHEHGTRADTLATLAAARAWAEERNEENLAAARAYLAGTGPFHQRAAQNVLAGAFPTDFYALVARWADWAGTVVAQWPEDPGRAEPDRAALEDVVRRASW